MMALIANHLWQSTLVAALTALLAVALRRNRAQVRYALWLTASAKFLVPFAALVTIGRLLDWRPATPVAASEVTAAIEAVSQPFTQIVGLATAAAPAGAAPVVTLPLVLFVVWVAGLIAVLAAWGAESRRVAAIVRAASPLDDPRVLDPLRRLDAAPLRVVSADTLLEPGVFGIVRPVLVWPRALSDHLSDEQIAAILKHELCHVRRRDNLAAAVHRAVQAVFWFHPLVWWLGARLVEERERACDEAVLALGSEPHTYAESILTTCRLQLEAPSCVAGITGPQVKTRIERIMTGETVAALTAWRKLMLAVTATSAIAAPLVAGVLSAPPVAAQAQAPAANAPPASFEVASVKPNPSRGGDVLMQVLPGRVNITNVTLMMLMRNAYRLQEFQIVGGPGWINSDRFNITARAEGNPSASQMQDMLRALLVDRFRLIAHQERRELPIYALVMSGSDRKTGVQLHQAKPCFRSPVNLPPQNPPLLETPCGFRLRPGMIAARGVSMAALAGTLANQVSRVVVDRTGLEGAFDLEMEFTPFQRPAALDGPAATNDRPVDSGPSIFTALQEQLGLKLDSDRGPVDVLVIDRAEPPTPD